MNDEERLLSIIRAAPLPSDKTDSQLAQEYRNWYYGVRTSRLRPGEPVRQPLVAEIPGWLCECGNRLPHDSLACVCGAVFHRRYARLELAKALAELEAAKPTARVPFDADFLTFWLSRTKNR